ncbi:hypothetical protein COX95_00850 [bacterium CG_4_10_14_0_2_um_filter_33_32]|nr:MAG: hypothetical protein AUJ93_01275 [bacterium CG2_30_33_46]PIU76899.1 MAG: hypothetical protein COS74_01785 [bacterium CG06_land_8_20_14_3_00_33_50]PIW81655.1 MAG: hypothetical protein COZ97_00465 [bacterium CG_4_8_14_3_um_filter_33_28]PIY84965.1 MAG: hypothetical protein COY76_04460 [bacterium CG_4_10_14_0_8_um_filter_33_57]PIZ86525.1 MAG: hypothetical protein COX95_00850 [bacterium CG_4_10_14_0_2_um_filter_33_32]PJA72231.1 MAG: hypothetical protein CO152_02665 [bacterium CG_4_9_14_3_um
MKFFKDRLDFFKENRQVLYAVFLLITIPIILIFNTLYITRSLVDLFNYELRLKAELASSVISITTANDLNNPDLIQGKIKKIVDKSLYDTIKSIEILVPSGDSFKVIASTSDTGGEIVLDKKDKDISNSKLDKSLTDYRFIWSQNETLATSRKDENEEYWSIVAPIFDDKDSKLGLVDIKVSSTFIKDKVDQTLTRSLVILLLSIIIVFLLIINNAKLFQYSILFRKLKEVDQMKDDFVSMAAHELRTPITAIRGFLSFLKEDNPKIDKDDIIKRVEDSAERLSELVKDLLDVSRIEQERVVFDIKSTDAMSIISSLIKEYELLAKEKGLKLEFDKKPEFPEILIDPDKFKQVMINLIGNSIKYTKKGSVSILLGNDRKQARITIKDTGIGMNEDERKNLFSKFYRIRNKETENISGTGLGLWITKQLVIKMKGKISVDSLPGIGSQFTLEFLIAKD